MSDQIVTNRKGPVLEITLNRPELGNAASDAMAIELAKLLLGAGESAEIVVLRGAGDDFCVGREGMGKRPPGVQPDALQLRKRNDVVFNCYGAFRRCEIPVIGVVKGRALGFGCAIAAVCDITLAADTAKFQVPEMSHNIMPTMVMSALVDRVPRKALTYLVWSTAVVSAARAREAGIVSEVFPAGRARGCGRGAVRADHAGAAAGAGRLQGLCARRPRHGRHRRDRVCAQHPCGDQLVRRDDAEAGDVTHGGGAPLPRLRRVGKGAVHGTLSPRKRCSAVPTRRAFRKPSGRRVGTARKSAPLPTLRTRVFFSRFQTALSNQSSAAR